jgi:S-adenosylmethionine decarboxylase
LKALGRHLIVECYDCDADILNDAQLVEQYMIEAAREAEATIIKSVFHPFFPHGVSGVVVIAESHLTIHTWPEYGYAAIDVFTCGDQAYPERACEYIQRTLKARTSTIIEFKRGQLPHNIEVEDDEQVVIPLKAALRKR